MDPAVHQSLAFLLLIVIGLLLKTKISSKAEVKGIKSLILCFALPATIFVALLKIKLTASLMALPVVQLMVNLILFGVAAGLLVPYLLQKSKASKRRTWIMMLPSMAPGLSCFPFLIEYLGDEALANAALADVGNKIFGLILLYLVAMRMYYKVQASDQDEQVDLMTRIKELVLSLIKEPINGVIVVALVLLGLGFNLDSLPLFLQNLAAKGSALTTGMVLVFIGLAMRIQRSEAQEIMSMLLFRSGLAFSISAVLLLVFSSQIPAFLAMVIVVFPQSSCSFWPFAHMSAVNSLEEDKGARESTFDLQTGLNIMACSLPFSSLLILALCSTGDLVADPIACLILSGVMLIAGLILRSLPSYVAEFAKGYWNLVLEIRELNQRGKEDLVRESS